MVMVMDLLDPRQGALSVIQILLVGPQGALSSAVPLQLGLHLDKHINPCQPSKA